MKKKFYGIILTGVIITLICFIGVINAEEQKDEKADLEKELEAYKSVYEPVSLPEVSADKKGEVVGEVNGELIYDGQLEKKLRGALYDMRSKIYSRKERELEAYIDYVIMEKEAKSKGISVKELFVEEIYKKVPPVSEEEVKKAFEEKKNMMKRTFEEVKGQIEVFLKRQKVDETREKYIEGLRKKYNVIIKLPKPEEPLYEVTPGVVPFKGNPQAPITIIEYSDFQCPFCKRASETVEEVLKKYPNEVKLTFKHYPLSFHKRAFASAVASLCANEQGKFWEYHDILFKNNTKLEDEDLKNYAKEINLDTTKFNECYDSNKFKEEVEKEMQSAQELDVTGTPAFFINGRKISGAQPIEEFTKVIEEELKKVKAATPTPTEPTPQPSQMQPSPTEPTPSVQPENPPVQQTPPPTGQ